MRVNSIRNNQIGIPQFKAQMSKKDIEFTLNTMKDKMFYNPYEQLPQLYTILEHAKKCPGKILSFEPFNNNEGKQGVYLRLDNKVINSSSYISDAYILLYDCYIAGQMNSITTHARMPKSVFDQKWFIDNRNVTEQDVLSLAYDA